MSRASLAKARKVATSSSCKSYRPSPVRTVGTTSAVPVACPPLPVYLKEADGHHIPFVYQCLDTFLIFQMCGTGPYSPPQPLSNALSLLGSCRDVPISDWTSAPPIPRPHPLLFDDLAHPQPYPPHTYIFFRVCAVSILEELECRVPYHAKLLGQLWFCRPVHLGQGDGS